jgi:hypothetical protein
MEMEEKGNPEEAKNLFIQAWNESTNDFEKFLAAHYVARHQTNPADRLIPSEKQEIIQLVDHSADGVNQPLKDFSTAQSIERYLLTYVNTLIIAS